MLTNSEHFRGQSITLGPEETSIVGQGKKSVAAGASRSILVDGRHPPLHPPIFTMHKILSSTVLSALLAAPLMGQAKAPASATAPIPLTATLPVDSKIKIGTLPN